MTGSKIFSTRQHLKIIRPKDILIFQTRVEKGGEKMSPKTSRIVYTSIICIIAFILLISNLGSNFKTDILSYKDIILNINDTKSNWLSSSDQEEFNNINSKHLSSKFQEYSIDPLKTDKFDSYTHSFSVNMPIEETKSYLEIVSKYDNVLKKYTHGEDFIEDVSGLFSARSILGYADVSNDLKFKSSIPDILLLEDYSSQSLYNKKDFDQKLKALGISAVVFPTNHEKMSEESEFRDPDYESSSNGILKFAVSDEVYKEIIDYTKKGCRLKLKSGLKIKEQKLTNVYGSIQGNSTKYRPLIIAAFYDGEIPSKYRDNKGSNFESSTYTPSILLECARMVTMQDTITPDRTVIFAFLSGKSIDKKGLDIFKELNIDGDLLLLDEIGNSNKFNLSLNENSKNFSNTLNYFMDKNNLKVVSNTTNEYVSEKHTYLSGINNTGTGLEFSSAYNTCKFILSIIGDECYNLDIVTANSREIRSIRRALRDYTIPISLVSLVFITFIVFKYPEIKDSN